MPQPASLKSTLATPNPLVKGHNFNSSTSNIICAKELANYQRPRTSQDCVTLTVLTGPLAHNGSETNEERTVMSNSDPVTPGQMQSRHSRCSQASRCQGPHHHHHPSGMRPPVHPGTLTLGAPLTSTSTPVLRLPWTPPLPPSLPRCCGSMLSTTPAHPASKSTPHYRSGPAPLTPHLTLNSDLTWAELLQGASDVPV